MDKAGLVQMASDFLASSAGNHIDKEIALTVDAAGVQIYDAPIFGFADAADPYFARLQEPEAVGAHFKLPGEWLSGASTVISFFLPYTDRVKSTNASEKMWPSPEWLHGRIEGQVVLNKLCRFIQETLIQEGFPSVVPSLDGRFWSKGSHKGSAGLEPGEKDGLSFTSNWSERHVAFVCGLGTFGLSKGLITKKGIAGRFGSIVSTLQLEPDVRPYKDIYEYCIRCGACIGQCPVHAITMEEGKNHEICSSFLGLTSSRFKPRYGCGKCQVNVSCQSCAPGAAK
jgi:epoxyqueuosine reductase QueG